MGILAAPLDDILSSRAKVRLLRLFATEPEPISARESARRIEMAKRSADLGLRDLVQSGVITRHGSGAQPTYVLNQQSALVRHAILPLFRGGAGDRTGGEQGAIAELYEMLRDAVAVPRDTDVLWAAIFGSTALGIDTEASDIDLAVIVHKETGMEPMQQRLADLVPIIRRRVGRTLSPIVMTRSQLRALAAEGHALVDGLRHGRVIAGTTPNLESLLRGSR